MSIETGASRERVFRALHDIAVALGGVLEPVALARLVVHHARDLLEAGAVGLYLFDEPSQELRPLHSSDAREGYPEPNIEPGVGAAGQAFLTGEPVIVNDYPNWAYAGPWAAANGVTAAVAVPLKVADRRTGAVSARAYVPRTWTSENAQTLMLLAAQVAPILEAARAYERTRAAQMKAEAAIRLRDDVLAGVSHDLAGPLARIRLYAELMQSEAAALEPPHTGDQIVAWSERVLAASDSMKTIIQELLDVAHLEMGDALQLDLRRTDLVALARRCIAEYEATGRRVQLVTIDPPVVGRWDEGRLRRALSNVVDNALKYSESGSDVLVSVHGQAGDGWAALRVQDRGVGIAPEEVPFVFERFYRGQHAVASAPGSGLGLAVVRQIVEQHGGAVDIESRPGAGTVVTLRLPRGADAEPRT
jgi:signal transduction histidine kinase